MFCINAFRIVKTLPETPLFVSLLVNNDVISLLLLFVLANGKAPNEAQIFLHFLFLLKIKWVNIR